MWTIYTYWNSQSLIQSLNAVVMVVGGADWLGLMKAIALVGLLVAASVGLARISFKEPGQYLLIVVFVFSGLFVPRVTVTVQDVRTGNVGTVANVPLGLAFVATTTSHVGKFLTDTFETAFGNPDELTFSKTGMAWGSGAMKTLASVRATDPKLQEAFQLFVAACVAPEIMDSAPKYSALAQSTDIMTLLAQGRGTTTGWLNPGRTVNMPANGAAGYNVLPCISTGGGSAYDALYAWLQAETTTQRSWLGQTLLPDTTPGNANALIAIYLPGVESYLLGTSRTIGDQIMQTMAVNMMNDSAGSMGLMRNDPGAVQLAAAAAQTSAQQASTYRLLGMVGSEVLPKLRNIVEIMVISVFPIVLLVLIVAGGGAGSVLKTYSMTAVWVQLWAPLYAIINGVLHPMTASRFAAAMAGASQTMTNTEGMLQTGYSEQGIAGGLVMLVPLIAYALVRGGEVAMGSAMSGLSGPVSSSAGAVGASAGAGNFSMANTSWGNHSSNNVGANKWDDGGSMSQGAWRSANDLFTTHSGLSSGQSSFSAANTVSDLGQYGASAKAAMSQQAGAAYSSAWQQAQEYGRTASTLAQHAYGSYLRNSQSSGTTSSISTAGSTGADTATQIAASRGQQAVADFARRHGLTQEEAFAAVMSAGASMGASAGTPGAGLGVPSASFNATVGTRLDASGRAGKQQAWEEAARVSQSADFKALESATTKAGVSTEGRVGAETRRGAESGKDSSLSQARQAMEQSRVSAQTAQQYQQLQQSINSIDSAGTRNLANAVVQELGGAAGARAAIASGNNAQIEAAIARVVARELSSMSGGALSPTRSGGPTAGGKPADDLVASTTGRTDGVAPAVAAAPAEVQSDARSARRGMTGVAGTARQGGQTAQGVVASAAADVRTGSQHVKEERAHVAAQHAAGEGKVHAAQAKAETPGAMAAAATAGSGRQAADALLGAATFVANSVTAPALSLANRITGQPAAGDSNDKGWKGR